MRKKRLEYRAMPGVRGSRGILSTGFSGMATWWMVFAIVATEVGFSAPTLTIHASADDGPDEATSPRLRRTETGSMHTALASYMTSHQHVRLLTAASPVKVVRRRRVTWTMDVWALSEYGESYNMMVMKPLGSYDEASWNGTFPCLLARGYGHTSCRGALPAGAESETWRLTLDNEGVPARWDGTFSRPPETPSGEPESFVGNMTCESLSGLVLARVIQRRGRYVGEANVTCQSASTFFYVIVDGPGVHFQMRINAAVRGGDGEKAEEDDGEDGGGVVVTKWLSWKSSVDPLGRLVVSDGLRSVAYAKEVLSGDSEVRLGGEIHSAVTHGDTSDPDQDGEPRLCNLATMTAACLILRSLSAGELATLGNVTGFNMQQYWIHNATVSTQGYVLGTGGVLSGRYTATATDPGAPEWTELPLPGADGCSTHLYDVSDCQSLPDGAPAVSDYRRDAVVHRAFPP